jgi:hypothetical protein
MKKRLLTLGLASAVLMGAGYLASGQASAHFGNNPEGAGRNYDPDRHAQMQDIIANRDYEAWVQVAGDRPVADYVTQENFNRFIEMMEAKHNGDMDTADAIREELGMPERGTHRGEGRGMRNGQGRGMGFHQGS